jgi:hypothetical protein
MSPSGKHLLLGGCRGVVRVYALATAHALHALDTPYWEQSVHDMHSAVTGVAMTCDESAIVSTASDGTMFVHTLTGEGLTPGMPAISGRGNDDIAQLSDTEPLLEPQDIVDVAAYTIEESKQKLEEDALLAAAEEKKMGVRGVLAACAPPTALAAQR